jgi:phage terminase large subunit
LPFLQAFDSGAYDRFVLVWHRRAGKDITCFNLVPRFALQKPRIITYVFPTLKMGREILWEGMDNDGHRFIDYFVPKEILSGKPNDTSMKMDFINGSIFRVGGSDNPDSLRGGNSSLFIFSEWSEHDPYAWTVVRPIVKANGGIVIFEYTPKGDNHAKFTYDQAGSLKKWWRQKLRADETGVFTPEQLEEERQELIAQYGDTEGQALFDQECMCSFDSPVVGAYYGAQLKRAEDEKRITNVPYESSVPVNTYWDLGVGDATTIWFVQTVCKEIRLIDYYETSGEGLDHYARILREKNYVYGDHYAPHDIEVRELSSGKSRLEIATSLGINFKIAPKLSLDDGINAARQIFNQCWFDSEHCARGINALKNYRKEWDEKNKVYKDRPKHDWSSHGADGFRYFAVSYKKQSESLPVYQPNRWRI